MKWPSYDANDTRKLWDGLVRSPPTQIGAGTLFYNARQIAPDWETKDAPGLERSCAISNVDMKKGKNGRIALAEIEAKLGQLPRTKTSVTPSGGGVHYYFKHVERVGSKNGQLGDG